MNKKYSAEQKRWIMETAHNKKDEEAVIEFNILTGMNLSLGAYRRLRHRLGIIKKSGRGKCEVKNV